MAISSRKKTRNRETGDETFPEGDVYLQPGAYWLIINKDQWSAYKDFLRSSQPNGQFRVFQTQENQDNGEAWVLIDVSRPINVSTDVVKVGEYKKGDTPEKVGVWEQESPSVIHQAGEIVDSASDYVGSVKGLMWAGAALTLGFAFLMRKR